MPPELGEKPEAPRRDVGGRARAVEPGSKVSTWLPVSEHDRLIQFAHKNGLAVSAVLRQLVRRRLP